MNACVKLQAQLITSNDFFMIPGFIILAGMQLLGYMLATLFNWPIPAPVVGIVLLFLTLLVLRRIPDSLAHTSTVLLPLLPLFLIPASTAIIEYGALLQRDGWIMAIALTLSLVVSFALIPFIFLFFIRLFGKD